MTFWDWLDDHYIEFVILLVLIGVILEDVIKAVK